MVCMQCQPGQKQMLHGREKKEMFLNSRMIYNGNYAARKAGLSN